MTVRRVVPNLPAEAAAGAERLLGTVLGLEKQMDLGWVQTFVSGEDSSTQVTILSADPSGLHPDVTIEVTDVDAIHARVQEAGLPVVYGPADEPWQVRRFFIRLPGGTLVNIMGHVGGESR